MTIQWTTALPAPLLKYLMDLAQTFIFPDKEDAEYSDLNTGNADDDRDTGQGWGEVYTAREVLDQLGIDYTIPKEEEEEEDD